MEDSVKQHQRRMGKFTIIIPDNHRTFHNVNIAINQRPSFRWMEHVKDIFVAFT